MPIPALGTRPRPWWWVGTGQWDPAQPALNTAADPQDEPSSWETAELDPAQVEQRIKEYNSQINSNLFMSLVWG